MLGNSYILHPSRACQDRDPTGHSLLIKVLLLHYLIYVQVLLLGNDLFPCDIFCFQEISIQGTEAFPLPIPVTRALEKSPVSKDIPKSLRPSG